MAALQILHFHYSGLLNCKLFKGKARFMVPISYSWKLGAIPHIKKENCLVHTLRGPPNGRWFHTPYAIQQLKAPKGVEGRAGASTLTPNHRSQELQLQNCKVKWDFGCAQTCRATWPTASVTSLAWLPLCRLRLWLCPFALVHWCTEEESKVPLGLTRSFRNTVSTLVSQKVGCTKIGHLSSSYLLDFPAGNEAFFCKGSLGDQRICIKVCSRQLPLFSSLQIHPKRDIHLSGTAGQYDQNDSALSNLYF